jgi:signal transduction histidine kinase
MTNETKPLNPPGFGEAWMGRWISRLPAIERPILLLRWLALLLVVILHWFDRSTAGVLFPVPEMALVIVGYNGVLLLLMRYVTWLQGPLNYLAVDSVIATLAVYLTGGYHSSFFVLYVFITIGAAFYLELARTIIVTMAMGLVYVGACYLNPAGLQSPYAQYILSAKVLLLLVVAVLCGLLLEQLRREHQETERERALVQRLKALNDLFQHLSTTLDLDHTLETVAEAPRNLLGADLTGIALFEEDGDQLTIAAAVGIDVPHGAGQRWPVDDALLATVLSSSQPYVVGDAAQRLQAFPVLLAAEQAMAPIASMVLVPLLLSGEPLGVLGAAYSESRHFSEEDLAFLHALGQEAALAIRNARLYAREREQVVRLRALDKLQEGFVSSVSHELRTPLTCVKTSVDLLQAASTELSEEQAELVRTIGHHVRRLEALVTDLLEITKLEAGQVTLAVQPTDLRQIVTRVVEALHPLTDRKSQTVSLRWPESVSPLEVDRRRIEQVLTNVLSNAIKFTPRQGKIDVRLAEMPESLQVCIADNGPGIPQHDQARIFEKFYVVADGRGLSGVGLGLYIARQIVELHGGRIWVDSQVGEGSTFCFALPRALWKGQR